MGITFPPSLTFGPWAAPVISRFRRVCRSIVAPLHLCGRRRSVCKSPFRRPSVEAVRGLRGELLRADGELLEGPTDTSGTDRGRPHLCDFGGPVAVNPAMNLVGGYHQPHPHMMHDPFLFPPRCPQERPYFQSWLLNSADMSPEFGNPPTYSPDYGPSGPAAGSGRLEALAGRLGRRKGGPGPPKKERRRTESINSAFAELRDCIPNVPADTKLSKIKTLRLATSYIGYLMEVLARDSQPEEAEGFRAELKKGESREKKRKGEPGEVCPASLVPGEKKMKGRTGWPQQVWALELNP